MARVTGAHLQQQALGGLDANGHGGSAPQNQSTTIDQAAMQLSKQTLRQAARAKRAGADPASGTVLAGHLMAQLPPSAGAVIAGFWPLPDEIDIRPLLHTLHRRGYPLVLPETTPRGHPLVFRRWQPGDALLPGRFGTVHPAGEVLEPDWLLVPLLAFDADCNRLGYGGGYYDRTLAARPSRTAVGCAFAVQRVAFIPTEDTDVRLDAVVTEQGVAWPGRA